MGKLGIVKSTDHFKEVMKLTDVSGDGNADAVLYEATTIRFAFITNWIKLSRNDNRWWHLLQNFIRYQNW